MIFATFTIYIYRNNHTIDFKKMIQKNNICHLYYIYIYRNNHTIDFKLMIQKKIATFTSRLWRNKDNTQQQAIKVCLSTME